MRSSLLRCYVAALVVCHITASPVADTSSATSVLKGLGVNTTTVSPVIGNAASTCKILNLLFPKNETFTTASADYTPLVDVPWSETCWLEPACFVTPNSAEQLSIIMKVLVALQTKFALRSGGHKSAPGFNSVGSDGVLIALQNLNKLAISSDKKTVTTGTGNRWRDVYGFVEPHGVLVVGGRVDMVGVGGYMLGGGVSLFPSTWGLALDRVSRFQVVLPDGSIVDATPSGQYADLYHALKGGMSNFGVVTEFDLISVPNDAYYELKAVGFNETSALLGVYGEYLANPSTDPKTTVEIQVQMNQFTTFFLGYVKPTVAPKDFDKFAQVPATVEIPPTNGTLDEIFALGAKTTTLGNWYGVSYSHKVTDGKVMQQTYALIQTAQALLPPTMFLTYAPQGMLPNLVTVGKSFNGGNLMGIQPVPQVWCDLVMTYSYVNETDRATQVVDTLFSQIETLIQKAAAELTFIFPSTAANFQKPLDGFGAQNLATIKAVAEKYDPQGVMQKLQNDGYLISNS